MAENYKHLYEQMKKMLTMYQDNLVPGFRQKIDELEADNDRLRKGWAEAISSYSKADSQILRWIPVSERLPDNVKSVIVCDICDGYFGCWEYCGGGEWSVGYLTYSINDITHWTPLPEPPKNGVEK